MLLAPGDKKSLFSKKHGFSCPPAAFNIPPSQRCFKFLSWAPRPSPLRSLRPRVEGLGRPWLHQKRLRLHRGHGHPVRRRDLHPHSLPDLPISLLEIILPKPRLPQPVHHPDLQPSSGRPAAGPRVRTMSVLGFTGKGNIQFSRLYHARMVGADLGSR